MPNSILFSSLKCLNKNSRQQKDKDLPRNLWFHTWYIATRPGVSLLAEEELPSEWITEFRREAEADSIQDGSSGPDREAQSVPNDKEHGLFGNFDTNDLGGTANHIRHLAKEGRTFYQGFLSLREDDAIASGYDCRQKWNDYMDQMMPELASQLNIPVTSMRWCAAFHMKKGHPHTHYLIWNESDEVRLNFISKDEQHTIREMFSKEIFRDEYQELIDQKTVMRDTLSAFSQKLTQDALDYIFRPMPSFLPESPSQTELEHMGYLLMDMVSSLQGDRSHNTFRYKYLPTECKDKVDRLSYYILERPAIRDSYRAYLDAINSKTSTASATEKGRIVSLKEAVGVIRSIVGNDILKACKTILEKNPDARKFQDTARILDEKAAGLLPRPVCPDTVRQDTARDELDDLLQPLSELARNTKHPEHFQFFLETEWEHYFETVSSHKTHYTIKYDNQYRSALKTIYGDFPDEEKKTALDLLASMAARNNLPALDALGKIYNGGISVPRDQEKAGLYFRKALKGYLSCLGGPGLSPDMSSYLEYRTGKYYEKGLGTDTDYASAADHYRRASGNKYADYALAKMYLSGKGPEPGWEHDRQIRESAALLRHSAGEGFSYAAYSYAKLAEQEALLQIPDDEIRHFYRTAAGGFRDDAINGNMNAALTLGFMYLHGKGASPDENTQGRTERLQDAALFLRQAADAGSGTAACSFARLGENEEELLIPEEDIAKYYHQAVRVFQKEAAEGNNESRISLAYLYINGKGTDMNEKSMENRIRKAALLFKAAADEGRGDAAYSYAKLAEQERFLKIPKDISDSYYLQARDFFLAGAQKGNSSAQASLGSMYLWGCGPVKRDTEAGKSWLLKAASQGSQSAERTLKIYQDCCNGMIASVCLRLLTDTARSLAIQKDLADNPLFRVHSRETMKDAASKDDRSR